jgi:hypothetical protein
MKSLILSCIAIFGVVAAASSQTTKYGVTVSAEKGVDFSTFKTYSWTKGQPAALQSVDAQIVAAVDRELAALGMKKAATGPGDVQVSYLSLTRTDVKVNAKPDEKGSLPEYAVGTLSVVLMEPKTSRRLLQLRIDKPIETKGPALNDAINAAVTELFTKYPTRQSK